MKAWAGRAVSNARAQLAPLLPVTCNQCRTLVNPEDNWVIGHIKARALYPELTWDQNNWTIEHRRCSDSTGNGIRKTKRRIETETQTKNENQIRKWNLEKEKTKRDATDGARPVSGGVGVQLAQRPPSSYLSRYHLEDVPWLADLADIPPDAAWPRAMTPAHPRATGTYGLQAETWILSKLGITLRWWQRLATRRQLEHDAAGRLVWQQVIESTPRRAGKSMRLGAMAMWRMAHADQFGEQQLVLHTGANLPICKEVQRRAWRGAESMGWTVRKSNGKEEIESPDGSRWMVRGRDSVYGYDVTLGMIDEAWDVGASVADEGLEPSLLERVDPQMVLTSTAHRQATSLMRRRFTAAVAGMGEDWSTLLLWWGAPDDAAVDDEAAWRLASPIWDESRRALITAKWLRAQNGEADTEADDPDPLEGFKAQYLNIWPAAFVARSNAASELFGVEEWERVSHFRPSGVPVVVAVEAWFTGGVSVAVAEALEDGRIGVSVEGFEDVPSAAAYAVSCGAPLLLAGKSICSDPLLVDAEARVGTNRVAVIEWRRLLDDGVVEHDGGLVLSGQVLGVRAVAGPEGPRLKSSGRTDAVKAAAWAVSAARVATESPAVF